jgi:hypothetical protein
MWTPDLGMSMVMPSSLVGSVFQPSLSSRVMVTFLSADGTASEPAETLARQKTPAAKVVKSEQRIIRNK